MSSQHRVRSEAEKKKIYEKIMNESTISSYDSNRCKYNQTNCIICLCPFQENSQIRNLTCHHIFHKDCIEEWIKAKLGEDPKCPICNIDLHKNEGHVDRAITIPVNENAHSQINLVESYIAPPPNFI